MQEDPYAILEIPSTASLREVRTAYHRLAALFHPDRNPGFLEAANQRLGQINEAYELIRASKLQDGVPATPKGEGKGQRRPAEPKPDPEAQDLAFRTRIASALLDSGFFSSPDEGRDGATVEILAEFLPPSSEIRACVSYREFSSSGSPRLTSLTKTFLRAASATSFGPGVGGPLLVGGAAISSTKVVICTRGTLLWTSSRIVSTDGIIVEDSVTANSVPLTDILAASRPRRPKGTVEIRLESGLALWFRTTKNEAASLCAYVEAL
jgi:hypothetical protein